MTPEDDGPEFKSIYDDYEPHRMDYQDIQQVEKGRRRAKAQQARYEKTGDSRHPATKKADAKRAWKDLEAKARVYEQNRKTGMLDGEIINQADYASDFDTCNTGGRSGSFTHGNNGCGCTGC